MCPDVADGGLEIYFSSPSFLLAAGGLALNSGYGSDEIDIGSKNKYEQTSRAQATTLLPTRADDETFADLIRFDPYPDSPDDPFADNPHGDNIRPAAFNTGV